MSEWYYAKNNQQYGPVSSEELKRLAASGQLLPTDLICKPGMTEWKKADCVRGLFPPQPAPTATATTPAKRLTRKHKKWLAIGSIVAVALLFVANHAVKSGGTTLMVKAITAGDYGTVLRFLDDGNDPNGYTANQKGLPLFIAVTTEHVQIAQLLLSRGASPNLGKLPPLHAAALMGHAQLGALLLQYGADVNAFVRGGNLLPEAELVYAGKTALHIAAQTGSPQMVQTLLQGGANPLLRNREGETPREGLISTGRQRALQQSDIQILQILEYAEGQAQQ